MKTPIKLRQLYKEETGEAYSNLIYAMNEVRINEEWDALTIEDYITWLEDKVIELLKI